LVLESQLKISQSSWIENMNEVREVGDESIVGKIFDTINGLHNNNLSRPKYLKTFPEEFHPRRHQLYRPFTPNNDMFFSLRSQGVPILTAYFLCESSNVTRLHRQLQQEKDCLQRDDALSLIKNI